MMAMLATGVLKGATASAAARLASARRTTPIAVADAVRARLRDRAEEPIRTASVAAAAPPCIAKSIALRRMPWHPGVSFETPIS